MKKKSKLIFFICTFAFLIVAFVIINLYINSRKSSSCTLVEDFTEFAYEIENVNIEENEIVISGWFFELNKVRNQERKRDRSSNLTGIMLWDINQPVKKQLDGSQMIENTVPMQMEYVDRPDVNKYFECEYDYSHSGFVAKIEKSKLDLQNSEYQIIIQTNKGSLYGIPSNSYIFNGSLRHIKSNEMFDLDVTGTDLEKIVNDGIILASIPENRTVIYQYGWKLYWIVEENSMYLKKDGSTVIEYMLDTTQFDRLSDFRKNNNWYWSNIGSDFKSYEITNQCNCGAYRVYVRDIPLEYSVTLIDTGCFENNDWIWRRIIRPCYSF